MVKNSNDPDNNKKGG